MIPVSPMLKSVRIHDMDFFQSIPITDIYLLPLADKTTDNFNFLIYFFIFKVLDL